MESMTEPLIIDGHNDTLLNLYLPKRGNGRSFFERSDLGHVDFPRAREGGFGGGFFAIFVPEEKDSDPSLVAERNDNEDEEPPVAPGAIGHAHAQTFTDQLVNLLFKLEADSAGEFRVVRKTSELRSCINEDAVAAIMHFEGAECIDSELKLLTPYYQSGLRSLGLVWSRPNAFAEGVPFKFPHSPDTGPGLTSAGRDLVQECNDLGIMVDLSHLNERGFWDVAELTDAPLVATHSGVHAICPSTRNLTDAQIDAIGGSGGIIGINFHVGFLRPDGKSDPNTPLTNITDHIQYVVDRIGIDHVALGSDFDGAHMPNELGDVSGLPRLMALLREQGFDDTSLQKLAHDNWMRVLEATWKD
jgi:membrane dipeptidase